MKGQWPYLGKVFQAMVSVMAVKIQLSSPNMVLRSGNWPGIFSSISTVIFGASLLWFCMTNHLRAILMGVVRQAVKRSAGSSGFMGSSWVAEQAASWMQFRIEEGGVEPKPPWDLPCWKATGIYSLLDLPNKSAYHSKQTQGHIPLI